MTGLVAVLIPVLLALAAWQLQRAAEKQALTDVYLERQGALASRPVTVLENVAFQRVVLTGRYDPIRYFLIDNQVSRGRVGYWVIASFNADDGRGWLVNRGWIPAPESRNTLPEVTAPAGQVEVVGALWLDTGLPLLLASDPWDAGWPKRVQRLNTTRMAQLLENTVPWEVRLEEGQPGVLSAAAPFVLPVRSEKHKGYAVQWFGLALVLLVGYLVFGFKRGRGDG